ncbi:NnrS family protein [Mariprofundus sp. NF]|uniref:NnrS family protein n=1 Tax=Mariprofundus sp. NF TaxID=2608716 RepID=UPI0015A28E91|nr:NnrS family protein [Mariprofundus sp. NF]NWF38870.1 NnrS family protein [Mariprofundus sp. NF]
MKIEIEPTPQQPKGWAPFALGFRPFFLLAGWFAILFMVTSLGGFVTGIWHYNYFDLSLWHAHEMLFGFAVAVIAGFLLTAVRNWTGLPTPTGWPLALLVLLWLIPRLVSVIPMAPEMFALLDMLFLPVLAVVIFLNLKQAKQSRNYPVPALLLLLAASNAGIHLDQLGLFEGLITPMLHLAVLTSVAIVVLIAGRVLPFFIAKTTGGQTDSIRIVEMLALPSVLLFAAINLLLPSPLLIAVAAIAVAGLHGLRMQRWYRPGIWQEPMLWILYLGYGWLVAGFLLYATALLLDIALGHALHGWTIGTVSMLTLGMMARVALGHSGRVIRALPWMTAAFALMVVAALVRVLLPMFNVQWLEIAVLISGSCWIAAFLVFAVRYSMLLLRPRLDGKEG